LRADSIDATDDPEGGRIHATQPEFHHWTLGASFLHHPDRMRQRTMLSPKFDARSRLRQLKAVIVQPPLAGLTRRNLVRESPDGVTLSGIDIRLNIGDAQIASRPPTAGLYALIVPTTPYALVVTTRQVVASPDAAAAGLVASSIGGRATAGSADYLTLAQALICGTLFLTLPSWSSAFRELPSKPILVGFVGGLALQIMAIQVAKMLGVPIDSGGQFIEKVVALVAGIGAVMDLSMDS
jgi:SulP family sulfate permease